MVREAFAFPLAGIPDTSSSIDGPSSLPSSSAANSAPGADGKAVAFLGDGGAQMTAEELMVASELKLPVAFIVFSNGSLGLVRQMQRHLCGGNYFATDLRSPDFVKLAAAYGIRGVRVTDGSKLDAAIARAVKSKSPMLVEVVVEKEAEA